MTRGAMRTTTHAEAVERARSMINYMPSVHPMSAKGTEPSLIRYRLSRNNGGKDPHARHPADYSYAFKTPTCDCSGFVAWCLGFDRFQEATFSQFSGWVSTDSMIIEARRKGAWFEEIRFPELGALVVTPGVRRHGRRIRVGHVGMMTGLPAEWDPAEPPWTDLIVTHCSSSNSRLTGGAIRTTGWSSGGGVFLRYLKAAG